MRRTLTLSILVLFALGFASQLFADYPVECPVCNNNTHTIALYECTACEYQWQEDAYSSTGYVPPRDEDCPPAGCGTIDNVPAWGMLCSHPICIGGLVWERE